MAFVETRVTALLLCGLMLLTIAAEGRDRGSAAMVRVRATGEMRVLVRPVPARASHTPAHLERALARRFGGWLGVRVRFVEHPTPAIALGALATGEADLAALGSPLPDRYQGIFRSGPVLRTVDEVMVYRRKSVRPRELADLDGREVVIPSGSPAWAALSAVPGVNLTVDETLGAAGLLAQLWRKKIELTIVGSDMLGALNPFYPELALAFGWSSARPVAWQFQAGAGDTLRYAAVHFWHDLRRSGELARLMHRHLGHQEPFDYVATRRLIRRIRKRLPRYRKLFEAAAEKHRWDWRLLAAVGYTESHWDPGAVSPTGVEGLMMLTEATAQQLGVNRDDPAQAIEGAARYLTNLRARLPDSIPEDEAPWFTLTAYNLGFAHLEGVRAVTGWDGGDPDRWYDVRSRLPLLRQSRWYSRLTSGQARGDVALDYVREVRRAYDQIRWHFP